MTQHSRKHWIKLYVEMLDDPKIGLLPDSAKWRFTSALLLAGETNEGGFLPEIEHAAWRLRIAPETLQSEMRMLAGRGLVELREYPDGGERWFITNFEERQQASSNAERQRQWRKRNVTPVTSRYASVTPEYRIQNTETEGMPTAPQTPPVETVVTDPEIAIREYIRSKIAVEPNELSPKYERDWRQPIKKMLLLADGDAERAKGLIDAALEEARKPKKEDGLPYKIVRPCGLLPFYTTQVDNLRAKSSAAGADTLWQRALEFASGGNGAGADSRLVAAIRAIGFPVIRAARADDIPRLKQQLATEYQRAATA